MATISNHQVRQVNLTLVPNSPVDVNSIQADKIVAKLVTLFENAKATRTQLADMLLIFDPVSQISLNVLQSENRIVFGLTQVSQYAEVQLDNFIRFSVESTKLINENQIKAYGLNILSVLDLDEVEDSGVFLREKFIKDISVLPQPVSSAGVKLTYAENDVRYQLKLDPRLGVDVSPTKSVMADFNAHYKKALPPYDELLDGCKSNYSRFGQDLVKLFS